MVYLVQFSCNKSIIKDFRDVYKIVCFMRVKQKRKC